MKNVYFYTGSFTHTFYKEIFKYPPENFKFIPSSPDLESDAIKKDIIKKWYSPLWGKIQNLIVATLSILRIPKIRVIQHPKCALIHSSQYPLLNQHPWVIDFEDVSAFTWYRRDVLDSGFVKRRLEHIFASSYCRAILPWTEAAKKSLENGLDCSSFRSKIKVVYPVMTPQPNIEEILEKKKNKSKVKILFVGTAFYAKGGVEALAVINELSRHYPIEFIMISNVPEEYRVQYAKNPAIHFLSRVSQEELHHHYKTSHLFLAPYHTDTFGFVILEAFSYGIPCVATDQFAIPEIVEDGKTGKIVKNSVSRFDEKGLPIHYFSSGDEKQLIALLKKPSADYLNRLKETVRLLLEKRDEIQKMSRQAYDEVAQGRFSRIARQKIIGEVYSILNLIPIRNKKGN
jgi:glycosyltransferase involved in cell wall biosynthesis